MQILGYLNNLIYSKESKPPPLPGPLAYFFISFFLPNRLEKIATAEEQQNRTYLFVKFPASYIQNNTNNTNKEN